MGSTFSQMFPPKPHWDPTKDMPDLSGRVMIVTGGNTGIGKETVKALLAKNARVYLAARDADKANKAIEELKETTKREAIFLQLDLSDIGSVRRAAAEFNSKEPSLHVLFNSAGVMWPAIDRLTANRYDLQFGTNVIGHFLLTTLLLPTMVETAKNAPAGQVRVVNTSSLASTLYKKISWDTLTDTPARKALGSKNLYSQSKFANVVFSAELARRYGSQGIVSTSLNPGNLKTDLQRYTTKLEMMILNLILYPAPYGAITQLWAGTAPEAAQANGKYLIPWARTGKAVPESDDEALGKKLWEWLEDQVAKH